MSCTLRPYFRREGGGESLDAFWEFDYFPMRSSSCWQCKHNPVSFPRGDGEETFLSVTALTLKACKECTGTFPLRQVALIRLPWVEVEIKHSVRTGTGKQWRGVALQTTESFCEKKPLAFCSSQPSSRFQAFKAELGNLRLKTPLLTLALCIACSWPGSQKSHL